MKAVDAIMSMRTAAAPAAPLLTPMLEDPDELVRVSVVVALPRIAAQPPTAAPLLKKMLADKAWPVRRQAALQLVEIGTEVPAAIPVLREGLSDPILPNRPGERRRRRGRDPACTLTAAESLASGLRSGGGHAQGTDTLCPASVQFGNAEVGVLWPTTVSSRQIPP